MKIASSINLSLCTDKRVCLMGLENTACPLICMRELSAGYNLLLKKSVS